MNILIVTLEFPYPPNSGGRIYTWNRIKYLSKNSNIFLFCMVNDCDFKYIEDTDYKKFIHSTYVYKRKNKILKSIMGFNLPFSVATRKYKSLKNDINNTIDTKNIDLIIVDHIQMLCNIDFNYVRLPIVLTQHNIEYDVFRSIYKNNKNFIKKLIFFREYLLMKRFEENIYKSNRVNLYSFISERDKSYFEDKYKINETILTPPGINLYEDSIDKEYGNNIVFTGKMDYEPNIEAVDWFCNSILPSILYEIPDAKFYIVGKNPTDKVKSMQNNNIIVTGEVESIDPYLIKADLVVIPLLSGGGVKIKLMEALSFFNIVISTRKGCEGTKFIHNKHLFIIDDKNEFADKCIQVLKRRDKYNYLLENTKLCLKKYYSWDHILQEYELYLRKLVFKKE